jgi:L-ascorbate metabolism protein UlaG (beta-lactamase superfamily)
MVLEHPGTVVACLRAPEWPVAAGVSQVRQPTRDLGSARSSERLRRFSGRRAYHELVLKLTLVGGPTALLEYAGLRWLTDPTLSPTGEYAGGLVKTSAPALTVEQIGEVDVVLLSHDHHSDNLHPAGRELLPAAGRVLTTVEGAERLGGNAIGLAPWQRIEVPARRGDPVTVTALPAQHGPDGSDPVMGQVIGFMLSGAALGSVYVSGDNASLDVVRAIVERCGQVEVAVLFAGAVQLAHRFDGAYLTLSSDRAAEAARILGARAVIPVHYEGWSHFTQGADSLRAAFAGNGVSDRLKLVERGASLEV